MANKEICPVGGVVGNGEAGVLAEASQLFPAFQNVAEIELYYFWINLPPLELDLIKELLKGRVVPAPGHLGLPQLLLHHHVVEDLKQQLEVPCPALSATW